MKKIIFSAIVLVALACNNSTKENALSDSTAVAEKPAESPDKCYAYLTEKDTVRLQLVLDGKQATGSLVYRLYEKDSNTGTINGMMQGDTLVADYTFASEGVQSVREVRFLKNGDMLVEGIGEMEERNGRMVYKNPGTIRYMGGLVLQKTDCDK